MGYLKGLSRVVALSFLFSLAFGQDRFESQIPEEEEQALAAIVEDNPDDIMTIMKDWESPEYNLIYRNRLPIPPVKQPRMVIRNPVTGNDIWYYEIEIRDFQQQIYPNLRPTRLVGYDGISPGPTLQIPVGTEAVVRFLNSAQRAESVHLHGSPSRAPFDGWAEDVTNSGQYKDYYYPNYQSARMMWYHDHAAHITAENANFGLAGAYILTDPAEDALGLPSGYGQFDIPLILSSKYYNEDGSLMSAAGEDDSLWGDIIHVNGQPWPFMDVQPRKYRLRFLNAALSRNFAMFFARSSSLNARIPFQVIASDAGLLEGPVQVSDIYLSVAERYEVVIDFSGHAGQQIELRNMEEAGGIGTDDDYEATNRIMRFNVSRNAVQDPSRVPATLRDVPFPAESSGIDHHFRFHRTNSEWRINGVGFADVNNRILARPPRGTIEIWELENSSGGWTHPIHLHLVDFRVLERRNADNGRGVMPYESAGLKDVVWLARHETVLVEAHYSPWNGVYMFHCHNLIHEDHDMMAAFNVTQLQNFGYRETTDFSDPMDPRWRARNFNRADFTGRTGPFTNQAIQTRVTELARQQPYSELEEVEEALEQAGGGAKVKREEEAAGPVPRYRRFRI